MKSIISRYILRNHAAPFIFGSFTVLFLFLFQFLLKYIDELVGKGLSEWVIAQLIALNVAWMVVLAVPMGVLFSTLFSFGGMSAAHEITIIKASGGSLVRMIFPVFVSSVVVAVMLFWFNDRVLPEANHRAKTLMSDIQRKKPTFSIESGQFSSELEGYTILARDVDSLTGVLKGVTIYDNTHGQRQNVVSADSGVVSFSPDYSKLILNLYDGEIHQLIPFDVNNYRKIDFRKYRFLMNASGFTFEQTDEKGMSRGDREMRISDMRKIVNEALAQQRETDKRIQEKFKDHYDFLMGKRASGGSVGQSDLSNMPQQQPPGATDRFSGLTIPVDTNVVKQPFPASRRQLKPRPAIVSRHGKASRKDSSLAAKETAKKDTSTLKPSISTTNTQLANLREVQKRVSFMRVSISSDLFQRVDSEVRARQFEVEIQKKYAIPFACIVFIFVGCPLGIMTRGGNFGLSAAISLGFYIFYWACLIGGEKLADRGMMSPVLSMWLGNILVGLMGLLLTVRVNNESVRFPGWRLVKRILGKG